MEIGQRIRELREERGISRDVLARASGMAANSIYLIESGRRAHPSSESLEKIARGLEVPVSALYAEEPVAPLGEAPETGMDYADMEHASFIKELENADLRELERIDALLRDVPREDPARSTAVRRGILRVYWENAHRRAFWEQIKDLDEDALEDLTRALDRELVEARAALEQTKERFKESGAVPAGMGDAYRRANEASTRSMMASLQLHALRHPRDREQAEREISALAGAGV